MATPAEEFESLLKEVVLSKRLSASKMAKLSEFSASHMDIDAQMVSAMYRTHKTLQSWQKLSSLYVFDALARTAKTLVTKGKLSPPSQQGKPNAASFLLKLEGVLEGLFRDLISITDFPEMKDKMKKVLDIWIKAGTFPTRTLDLLSQITLGTPMDQVPDRTSAVSDPRRSAMPPAMNEAVKSVTPPAAPTPASNQSGVLPPALLALLGAAAQGTPNPAPSPTSATSDSSFATQLALLQQLATGGSINPGIGQPSTNASSSLARASSLSSTSLAHHTAVEGVNNFPTNGQQNDFPKKQSRFSSQTDSHLNRDDPPLTSRDDYYGSEQRGEYGNRPHRDPRRGRGGGVASGYGQGRNERSPRSSSRSRSPRPNRREDTRGGRLRGPGAYSPPRRNINEDGYRSRSSNSYGGSGQTSSHMDDYSQRAEGDGDRGYRSQPGSGRRGRRGGGPQQQQSRPIPTFESNAESPAPAPIPTSFDASLPSPNSFPSSDAQQLNPRVLSVPNLNEFDFSTCDFSRPDSWESLAASFEKTHGYIPGQEELMQLVMMVAVNSMPVDPASNGTFDTASAENPQSGDSNQPASQEPVLDVDGARLDTHRATQEPDPVKAEAEYSGSRLDTHKPLDDQVATEEMVDRTEAASEAGYSRSSSMQMSESPDPND